MKLYFADLSLRCVVAILVLIAGVSQTVYGNGDQCNWSGTWEGTLDISTFLGQEAILDAEATLQQSGNVVNGTVIVRIRVEGVIEDTIYDLQGQVNEFNRLIGTLDSNKSSHLDGFEWEFVSGSECNEVDGIQFSQLFIDDEPIGQVFELFYDLTRKSPSSPTPPVDSKSPTIEIAALGEVEIDGQKLSSGDTLEFPSLYSTKIKVAKNDSVELRWKCFDQVVMIHWIITNIVLEKEFKEPGGPDDLVFDATVAIFESGIDICEDAFPLSETLTPQAAFTNPLVKLELIQGSMGITIDHELLTVNIETPAGIISADHKDAFISQIMSDGRTLIQANQGALTFTSADPSIGSMTIGVGEEVDLDPVRNNNGGSGGNGDTLSLAQALDANSSTRLEDSEIKSAIQKWILGEVVEGTGGETINDQQILDLIRMWITAENISRAAASAVPLNQPLVVQGSVLSQKGDQFRLKVLGQGIVETQVQIYDLSGKRALTHVTKGNQLTFAMTDESGHRLANGVYLYIVTARGPNEHSIRSEVRKMGLLN